jgi:hypothetical protein
MTNYRVDLLDRHGRILTSVDVQYDSDEAAEIDVAARLRGAPAELWSGDRLVRRFRRVRDEA